MRNYSDLNLKNKLIFKRIDINSPIEQGIVQTNLRIKSHAKSIEKLRSQGARVVLLAHQGRAGEENFVSLEQHAKLLEKELGIRIQYTDEITGAAAKKAISNLKAGEVLLLNNVRLLEDESTHTYDAEIVKELASLGDYFILDALSVAHRKHASVVGFTHHLPSAAGKVLCEEIEALKKIDNAKSIVFFFGGAKTEDSFNLMKKWLSLKKVKKILIGGVLALLFIYAKGFDVGEHTFKYLKQNALIKRVKEARLMLDRYSDKIALPVDVALNVNGKRVNASLNKIKNRPIFDIGKKTIAKYERILLKADFIFMNGPAGVYELKEFEQGTRKILNAVSMSKGFSLVGGGHTITAIEKFKIPKKRFGYISLSGKALVEYLDGKELPGLKALIKNIEKFSIGT